MLKKKLLNKNEIDSNYEENFDLKKEIENLKKENQKLKNKDIFGSE